MSALLTSRSEVRPRWFWSSPVSGASLRVLLRVVGSAVAILLGLVVLVWILRGLRLLLWYTSAWP